MSDQLMVLSLDDISWGAAEVLLKKRSSNIFHKADTPIKQCIHPQSWKLGRFAMPETCENWLGLVNSCVYYARQTCEIFQVLRYAVDFKAPRELWNPLSKTVLSEYSFIWNIGHVHIWNVYIYIFLFLFISNIFIQGKSIQ